VTKRQQLIVMGDSDICVGFFFGFVFLFCAGYGVMA
jgi:hypothetical protein